jgi:hypothetical protein
MEKAEQLKFQHLPAGAQYETLWRLALSGLTVEQVSERTGWSPADHQSGARARDRAVARCAERAGPAPRIGRMMVSLLATYAGPHHARFHPALHARVTSCASRRYEAR